MKAAISAYDKDLNSQINPRFGRCDYLLIVNTDDMSFEAFANENKDLTGGAGIQTASFVISKGADCIVTGECGPNAMGVFRAANMDVYTGQAGPVIEAVNRLKEGKLGPAARQGADDRLESGDGFSRQGSFGRPVPGSSAPGSPASGSRGSFGRGSGIGCGGGRGMGRGGGRGMGGCGMGRRG